MPRTFKAPRLKRNISATEKENPQREKFWKATKSSFFITASRVGDWLSEGITPFRRSKRRRWRRRNQNPDKACGSNIHPSSSARHTGVLFSHAVTAHQGELHSACPTVNKEGFYAILNKSEVSQLMEDRAIGLQLFLIDWNDGWS